MDEVSLQPKHYLTCLWPGMAELWWRGRLSALPAAVAFAAVVNALLIAKFMYSDWLSGGLVLLACWVVAAAWLVLTIRAIRELPLLLTPRQASEEPDRFPEAQAAFLRADYPEAEKLLGETLEVDPRDPPALLLLSAVYRHTGRLHASKLLLAGICKLEVAEAWQLEFAGEQARLQRDIAARDETDSDELEEDEQQPDDQESSEQKVREQNVSEQDVSEQDVSEQDVSEQDVSEQEVSEQKGEDESSRSAAA